MNKKIIIPIIIVAAIIILAGVWYGQSQPEQVANSPVGETGEEIDTRDWLTYRNEEFGIEIKYPREMLIRKGDEIYPVSGMTGMLNSFMACYFSINNDGFKICKNTGKVGFEFKKDVEIKNSLEGFDYFYSKKKEARDEFDIGPPRLLDLSRIVVNGHQYFFYKAEYFGGDSTSVEVYIPHQSVLLVYKYSIYPIENDSDTAFHEQVAKAILLSLKLDN